MSLSRAQPGLPGDLYSLGPDPTRTITFATGLATIRLLVISLAISPLRRLSPRLSWLIRFRRLLGLFAFFYASLHLLTYIGLYPTLMFMRSSQTYSSVDMSQWAWPRGCYCCRSRLLPRSGPFVSWAKLAAPSSACLCCRLPWRGALLVAGKAGSSYSHDHHAAAGCSVARAAGGDVDQ